MKQKLESRLPSAPLPEAEENPKGAAAARCAVYRRQIDALLDAVRRAATAIDNPADLWEMRRGLREIHGIDNQGGAK